jgi:hypothetical protein
MFRDINVRTDKSSTPFAASTAASSPTFAAGATSTMTLAR